MRIAERNYYISIESYFDSEDTDFSLSISKNLPRLLKQWNSTTRISPVWPLYVSAGPRKTFAVRSERQIQEIIFLSSVDPGSIYDNVDLATLQELENGQIWLSLGAHNVIVLSHNEDTSQEFREFCIRNDVSSESWIIHEEKGGRYHSNDIRYFRPSEYSVRSDLRGTETAAAAYELPAFPANDPTSFTIIELYALLAVINGRSGDNFPKMSGDCLGIESVVSALLKREEVSDLEKRDLLLSLNAGLSRLSSQAFSGTSPITRTECHFWPHSLLGIGTANYALRNVTDFIAACVRESKFNSRFEALKNSELKVVTNTAREGWPSCFNIGRDQILSAQTDVQLDESALRPSDLFDIPNPITYYSGRDGFRNGLLTTSAPLMSVSGCNSVQWNLGTITHELSHRIISGKLEEIYRAAVQQIADDPKCETLESYFEKAPRTLGDIAQMFLAMTLLIRHAEDYPDSTSLKNAMRDPISFLEEAKVFYSEELEEISVHIFDYYHFYGLDAKKYVDFIWLSWAVQPAIRLKLDYYVKRTVTALAISHYDAQNWRARAIGDFESVMKSEPLASRLPFRNEVLALLNSEESRAELEFYLEQMEHLIGIFYFLFRSDDLRHRAMSEPYASPSSISVVEDSGRRHVRRTNYEAKRLVFADGSAKLSRPSFSNPLLFLRDFSRDLEPSSAKSTWLLHMLAFNGTDT